MGVLKDKDEKMQTPEVIKENKSVSIIVYTVIAVWVGVFIILTYFTLNG